MIRQATIDDLNTIVHLCERVKIQIRKENIHLWGDDYPNQEIFQYDIENNLGWVVIQNNKTVGYIAVSYDIDEDFEHLEDHEAEETFKKRLLEECLIEKTEYCSFHRLMIDPAYQRQHLASFFLQIIEQTINKNYFALFTSPDNHKAIALYQKAGYEIRSTYSFPYGNMLLMTKKVSL